MPLNLENIDLGGFGISEEDDIQPELNNQVRANMDEALKINPDQHAQTTKLSEQSGVPEFAVESDPAQVEHGLKLDNIDFSQMSKRNPNTEKYLTDFNNSVIAQDDIDVLQSIEDTLLTVADVGRAFPAGLIGGFGSAFEGAGRTLQAGANITARALDVILPESLDDYLYLSDNPSALERAGLMLSPQTLLRWEGKGLSKVAEDVGVPQERSNIATDISGALGQMTQQIMVHIANPIASGVALFSQGVDQQGQRQEATNTEGESLESDLALLTGGLITVASEKIGLDKLLERLPPKIKNDALRNMIDIVLAGGIESIQEIVENIGHGLLEQFTTNPDAEIFKGLEHEAIVAGGAGAIARAVINAVTPGRLRSVQEQESTKDSKGQIEQQKIDQLNEQAEKSKLRERDKESFKQFVNEVDGENNTNVFIDGAQTSLYLQSKTPEEIEADTALKLLNDQAREASQLGTDVQIPVADFAAEIAGTDHYAELRDSMTMSDETTSPFRQEQVKQETETYIKTLMEEADQNTSEYVEAQEIFTQVRDQLIDTGTVTPANASIMAQIVPAWATAQARRQGKTVQQVYQDSGLTIEGPATGERARLEGELILEQQDITTTDLQQSLRDEGVDVSLRGEGDVIILDKIIVPEDQREVGVGTAAMQRVIDWADANGKTVALSPSKDFGGTVARLKKFYKSLGFVENKGKNKNLEISETMFYTPKDVAPVEQRATIQGQDVVRQRRKLKGSKARELFDKMSREELISELLKHELTGIKGRRSFNIEVEDAPVIASIDADSLKWINDNLSPDHGDALLQAVADAIQDETEFSYHISGDEFYVLGETQEEVESAVNKAIEKLTTAVITATKPDGTTITLNGLNITVGIGETKDVADQKLKSEKVRREEAGERAPRGEQPLGSAIRSPEGFDPDGDVSEVEVPEDEAIRRELERDRREEAVTAEARATQQETIERAKTRTDKQALVEFNRAKSGESVTFTHRSFADFTSFDDARLDDIDPTRTPSTHFGHYLSADDVGNAPRHGPELSVHEFTLNNPLIISAEAFESVTDGITHEEVIEKRQQFIEMGHDGILVEDLNWAIVFESNTATKLEEEFEEVLFQAPTEPVELKNEGDVDLVETGKPVTFNFVHNTESATTIFGKPSKGDPFGRDFEPAARFVNIASKERAAEVTGNWIGGKLTFRNPLVIPADGIKWKETLSKQYGGKTGKKLSLALITDGYDGVITTEERHISETIDLTTFDEAKALFQRPDKEKEARGYYDPVNSIIRLTDAADLSTFLHEFAHFMYEMEVNGDTEMLQSINSWYKRNAEDVAKEANSYLGEDFDALKQLEQADYRGEHEAPGPEEDAPLYDVTKEGDVYPDDIYSSEGLRFYGTGQDKADRESISVIQSVRGKPNARVKMYRAVPHVKTSEETLNQLEKEMDAYLKRGTLPPGISDGSAWYDNAWETREELRKMEDEPVAIVKINTGDWVTLSKTYAKEHGESALNGEYKIISKTVNAKELFTNGDSINEFGYWEKGEQVFEQPVDRPTIKEGSITPEDVIAFLDEGTTGIKDKDAAIRRAVHEQFARGFETYLMEGKAPSIELRNAFRAFARWLSRIYQALRGQLDVKLDAEMRQVFDRLLATEEQITAAEARARVEPMFTDAAMAGMTEEEFVDYQKRQEKVKDVQSETLRDKIIKQLTRQTKAWWKEEKQDIIDEEIESLNKQQVYLTRTRLRDGDMKLDHATVKEMAGEEKTDKLDRKSVVIPPELRNMTAKGQQGVHPDEAAAFFGYKSGSEMLHDLTTAPNIKVQAETNAEKRMIDRHGDILTDGTIDQEANEAVRNEERGKLILAELKTLAKGTNAPTIERNTIKDLAATNIAKLSFREIHPGKYRKAEIRAAQESAAMLAEGNREGAASAKMRQVMNYYLGMAATNAKNDTVKIVDRMARYNKKKVREEIMKAEGGYWDQIVKILSRFEFRKVATLKEIESLNTWMAERNGEAGDALVLTNAVLNESFVTHWKNVPFSDLQGINDSVKNIEHVARYANKLTRMQEEIDFNKLVDRWITSMNEKVETRFVSKRADVAEGRKWGRWFMAQMTKIPMLASWLDGGERAGISHQIMIQPFTDAYNVEIKLWEEAGKPVMDAIENRSKEDRKRHNQKNYIPEIDDNLYGHQILAVALNTGNQSNLKKMLLGEGWANPDIEAEIAFDNSKLQAVLSRMTKSDWELVQKIWDQMDTLYPQLAEVHRRTTGLTPPKVEATPLDVTVDGEVIKLKGGYYPVKYDPNRDQRAALNEDKLNAETESMFSNNASIQASVNTGATNERTGYYAPIRLSLDVVPAHFQETIHYITHHDAVREVNRLTRNKQVAQTIKEKLGPEEYAQLRPWLNDIAKDGREAPTKMFWDDMLGKLRFGVTLGTMGFKASTGIIQISGMSNTVAEVGLGNVMQSLRSILGSTTTIKQAWDFAVENSQVLEHRTQTMDREIKNAMKRIEGKRGILAAAQEASMKHIALIQTYMVDLPSWHAAYIKGMKDWGDEARSFQYADWVIENVQGSGATKDMARIMRGQAETGRMFTMFMTFFSSLWNMERDLVKGAKTGRYSTTNVAAKVMFLFTIPVIFEMIMRGELGEPEDEDDRLQKMLTQVAMYPVQSIPFVRDIASATTGQFGYNISPLQSIIEQGTRTLPELITRGFTDEEITKGQIKGATKFIGATLGIPGMNQAWATGEHLFDVLEEGEEFTTHQLLFGPKR